MSRVSTVRVFWGSAVPFGVAVGVLRLGHFPTVYAVSMGVVIGALFGGLSVWMQKRAVHSLEVQGIDPGVVVRPLNFTVRGRTKTRPCSENHQTEELRQRPSV
jgi:hypothetical protein